MSTKCFLQSLESICVSRPPAKQQRKQYEDVLTPENDAGLVALFLECTEGGQRCSTNRLWGARQAPTCPDIDRGCLKMIQSAVDRGLPVEPELWTCRSGGPSSCCQQLPD